MTATAEHDALLDLLAPATADVGRQHQRFAFVQGLRWGIASMPRVTAVLVLGWLGGSYVVGGPLFPPLALPLFIALTPLASAVAVHLQARRLTPDAYDAARVLDDNLHTRDRFSAAVELSARERSEFSSERSSALAHAAVEDGLDALRQADRSRTEVPSTKSRWPWATAVFALALAFLPSALDFTEGVGEPAQSNGGPDGTAADATGPNGTDEGPRDPNGARAMPPNTGPEPDGTPEPDAATPQAADDEGTPRRDPDRPKESPTAGGITPSNGMRSTRDAGTAAASGASAGSPSQSGAGGGGRGAAGSESDSSEQPERQGKRASQKGRGAETEAREAEPSSATPSGPSRGGGRLAAVSHERTGLERGSEEADDVETDEDEIEDEDEDNEARGGIMPMRRDRRQSASRELSISGTGPPDDGRGGPTPPKKSRGTASLVLGIRLPDHVRGQPNPGTAKTSLEPVPPEAEPGSARPATAARATSPSPNPQTRARSTGELADVVRGYHELMRGSKPRAADAPRTPR